MVNEFAKRGLTKWSFVQKHPEYKRTTLLNWLSKYFPNTASEEEQPLCFIIVEKRSIKKLQIKIRRTGLAIKI